MILTKDDLQKALEIKNNKLFRQLGDFLQEHVIDPLFGLKDDVAVLKDDVAVLKITVDTVERKVDALFLRGDRHDARLKDHETRITTLEEASVCP